MPESRMYTGSVRVSAKPLTSRATSSAPKARAGTVARKTSGSASNTFISSPVAVNMASGKYFDGAGHRQRVWLQVAVRLAIGYGRGLWVYAGKLRARIVCTGKVALQRQCVRQCAAGMLAIARFHVREPEVIAISGVARNCFRLRSCS